MDSNYTSFIESKTPRAHETGFAPRALNLALFPFQVDIVSWACRKGRAAIFAATGMGKTAMQLEWARQVCEHTQGNVLILAPLAVAAQTAREGAKFGIEVTVCESYEDVRPGINITNYEKLHKFDAGMFSGIALDESSILKSFDGKTRTQIIDTFADLSFKLACTATPAPNDFMELGNHSEFLGVMPRVDMLATFFTHDGGDTSKWRLKGHAEADFWRWVCSWAVALTRPSDLGYADGGFDLPPLNMHSVVIETGKPAPGMLFAMEAESLLERRAARRESLAERVAACAALVNASEETWLIWCDLNDEGDALERAIPGAVQVAGKDSNEVKERALQDFAEGKIRVLVTKPSIAGWGLNWQQCHKMAFVGLSDSFEQFYQAVRRCWRFGQLHPVDCYVITADTEGAVVANIARKEGDAARMIAEMVQHTKAITSAELRATTRERDEYKADVSASEKWTLHLGDCVDVVGGLESGSIDYSIFSPPFAALYTYSNSPRDMGNTRNHEEFFRQFGYLVDQLYRTLKPGRLVSVHCFNIPKMKERDGVIGLYDFRGDIIRAFEKSGFIFHSEVCIWKDPVVAMQRTKALGLLYKQLKKDSAMSRQGIPDYLVTMRKPGTNPEPVTKNPEEFPCALWQRFASPVWMDINPSDTLQRESAREDKDEKHICPLQLEVIERAVRLWTNPGDLVLSPFAGIGSELYVAVKMGRRAVGAELKKSYWKQAVLNLQRAELEAEQRTLFDGEPAEMELEHQ